MDNELHGLLEKVSEEYNRLTGIERREVIDGLFEKTTKKVSNPVVAMLCDKILMEEQNIMVEKTKETEKKETAIAEKVVEPKPEMKELAEVPESTLAKKKGFRNLNLQ